MSERRRNDAVWRDKDIETLKRLVEQGMSDVDIAPKLYITKEQVRHKRRQLGLERPAATNKQATYQRRYVEAQKERCGHCVSWDLFCGVCLNPDAKRFYEDEIPFDTPACVQFTKNEETE